VKTHLPDGSLSYNQKKHNRTPSNATILATSAQINYAQFQPAPPYGAPVGMGYGISLPLPQNPPALRFMNTATDERNDAAGLPLASVLVLRNLARQMAKLDDAPQRDGAPSAPKVGRGDGDVEMEERDSWVRKVFAPVKDQLYFVMAHNLTLREHMVTLTKAIAAGGG